MKRVKILLVFLLIAVMTSCNLVKDYDFDSNPNGLRNISILEYFTTGYDKSRTIFVEAVKRAGMEDIIEKGGITIIVPNNIAFSGVLSDFGVTSVNDLPPSAVRALLEYLIVPGDYRFNTMKGGVNYQLTALNGNPLWIKQEGTNGEIYINDAADKLTTSRVAVKQQDYLFKNNVVAQVVESFLTYRTPIAQTETGQLLPTDPREPITESISCKADVHIYNASAANRVQNFNLPTLGVYLCLRSAIAWPTIPFSTETRMGLFKFDLSELSIAAEDIVAVSFKSQILSLQSQSYNGNGNPTANQRDKFKLALFGFDNGQDWEDATATWGSMFYNGSTSLTSQYLNSSTLLAYSPDYNVPAGALTQAFFNTPGNEMFTYIDITKHITDAKTALEADPAKKMLSLAASEVPDPINNTVGSRGIYLRSRDMEIPGIDAYASRLVVDGPMRSNMVMVRNNAITLDKNMVAMLKPETSFCFGGPVVADGYDYKPCNIIYSIKELPTNGYITRYNIGIPLAGKFTQEEMLQGVIKYVSKGAETADSFKLKVIDYLKASYYDEDNNNYIEVKVQ